MNRSNLQIWFSTSYNHEDRQAFAGYVWKLGSEPIETGFHAMSLGTVKDNVFADFKALEYLFPQLSKKILKNTISRRKIKLQIFSHNLTLAQTFQDLILPPRREYLIRIFRMVKSECSKFHSVGFGWISKKENPAVSKLKKWLMSNHGLGAEIPLPEEYNCQKPAITLEHQNISLNPASNEKNTLEIETEIIESAVNEDVLKSIQIIRKHIELTKHHLSDLEKEFRCLISKLNIETKQKLGEAV